MLDFLFFPKHTPTHQRDTAERFIEERRQCKDRHEENRIHGPRRQLGIGLHHVSKAGNHQVVDDIEAVAGAGHIGGESTCTVKLCLEPAHHRKTHQPAVQAIQRTPQILRRSVVLPEGSADKDSPGDNGADHERNPGFGEFLLHRVMGKDKVSQQERNQIEKWIVEVPKPIGCSRAGITDERLLACPEQHAQQDDPDDVRLTALVPDLIFPVQRADQQKHQAQQPQHLDEPERADAADRHDEVFTYGWNAVKNTLPCRHNRIEVPHHPVEYKQADGPRHQ